MKNWVPSLLFFTLVLAAAITLACGSGNRQLDSVSLTPSTADAKNFPDGEVPFTATGYYSAKPSPVTPFSATWVHALRRDPLST